jgi:hypothetical protein
VATADHIRRVSRRAARHPAAGSDRRPVVQAAAVDTTEVERVMQSMWLELSLIVLGIIASGFLAGWEIALVSSKTAAL